MGQPPPPHGPQGPHGSYPGQPGQPPQGPPPGYGQQGPPGQHPPQGMPPQGPPPGYGQPSQGPPGHQQGPPPGYGQQPPQGPPGQYPPQGPPGQYPPGYGPQGAGAPKKKTGLIIGGAIGAVLLVVAIGGVLVFVNSGGEYVALPDDCSEAIDGSVLEPFFDGSVPALTGGFNEDRGGDDGSYGTLTCEANADGVTVEVHAELIDLEHPDTREELDEIFDGDDLTSEFTAGRVEPGEVSVVDFTEGVPASILWDHTSVGDEGIVLAMTTDGDDDRFSVSNSFAMGAFLTDNIAGGFLVNDSNGGRDVQDLFNAVDSASGDLAGQLTRVAEK